MVDILKDARPESVKAGERFIQRIKTGIISKIKLEGNLSFEEYPLENASENFTLYLESEDYRKSINYQ
ncbi:hypothetical protein [Leptospira kanakyensis]|uniref:hypothetical protein n=1 Tax=Leptospira kanakyensis TaxID=2484968 RepID=UPI00223E4B99|nr:hypothetical protein [Leptospira kanakyensis]MCW7469591.1 hypothetical protein [Leptospira kanakyensis]